MRHMWRSFFPNDLRNSAIWQDTAWFVSKNFLGKENCGMRDAFRHLSRKMQRDDQLLREKLSFIVVSGFKN